MPVSKMSDLSFFEFKLSNIDSEGREVMGLCLGEIPFPAGDRVRW